VHSRCSGCAGGALQGHCRRTCGDCRHTSGAVQVHHRCTLGAVQMHSRRSSGALSGALEEQYCTGAVQQAQLVSAITHAPGTLPRCRGTACSELCPGPEDHPHARTSGMHIVSGWPASTFTSASWQASSSCSMLIPFSLLLFSLFFFSFLPAVRLGLIHLSWAGCPDSAEHSFCFVPGSCPSFCPSVPAQAALLRGCPSSGRPSKWRST